MMVPKVFIILLMIVCAVAATGKSKESFEETNLDSMQKTMDNLKAAQAKHENIKNQYNKVKAEHDGLKTKTENAEALLKKYSGEPTELKYNEKELKDKQNAKKKVDDCFAKNTKIEKEVQPMKDEYNGYERRIEELKQEKIALEKEINDLNASIQSFKQKIAHMRNVEIPDVKKRIADHTRDYHICIDRKSWSPSVVGYDLAYWNSHPTQYIGGTVNVNNNAFTIGMFINAPYTGEYQTLLKSNYYNSSIYYRNSSSYGLEMSLQNNYLIMRNDGQTMSIPIINGNIFVIIVQSRNGSTYYVNGKNYGGLSQSWSNGMGNINFYTINNGGIRDLAVIRRALNDQEIQKYEGYFTYRWFRSGEPLPVNHPYREEMPYK